MGWNNFYFRKSPKKYCSKYNNYAPKIPFYLFGKPITGSFPGMIPTYFIIYYVFSWVLKSTRVKYATFGQMCFRREPSSEGCHKPRPLDLFKPDLYWKLSSTSQRRPRPPVPVQCPVFSVLRLHLVLTSLSPRFRVKVTFSAIQSLNSAFYSDQTSVVPTCLFP